MLSLFLIDRWGAIKERGIYWEDWWKDATNTLGIDEKTHTVTMVGMTRLHQSHWLKMKKCWPVFDEKRPRNTLGINRKVAKNIYIGYQRKYAKKPDWSGQRWKWAKFKNRGYWQKNGLAIALDIAIAMYHYQLKSRSQEDIGPLVEKVIEKLHALSPIRRHSTIFSSGQHLLLSSRESC